MKLLTTAEAAAHCRVQPVTIRRWVQKGWLRPVDRFSKPRLFDVEAVIECHAQHRPAGERARLDQATHRWERDHPDIE